MRPAQVARKPFRVAAAVLFALALVTCVGGVIQWNWELVLGGLTGLLVFGPIAWTGR